MSSSTGLKLFDDLLDAERLRQERAQRRYLLLECAGLLGVHAGGERLLVGLQQALQRCCYVLVARLSTFTRRDRLDFTQHHAEHFAVDRVAVLHRLAHTRLDFVD